jgi:hypothetical protein
VHCEFSKAMVETKNIGPFERHEIPRLRYPRKKSLNIAVINDYMLQYITHNKTLEDLHLQLLLKSQ